MNMCYFQQEVIVWIYGNNFISMVELLRVLPGQAGALGMQAASNTDV